MDKSTQLMFALQSPVGLRFGATQAVEAERITFEMDVDLDKGTVCPFRMELTGLVETVMGSVRIDRVLPKRQGTLPHYIAKIVEMPDLDRRAYDGWRRDQATGGISRRMERDPEAMKERISDQMRGSTDAEARMVLEKMNTKAIYQRKTKDRIEGDPFGLTHEDEGHHIEDGASMREKLRASAHQTAEQAEQHASAAQPAQTASADINPLPQPPSTASAAGGPEWLRPMQAPEATESTPGMDWLSDTESPASDPVDAPPAAAEHIPAAANAEPATAPEPAPELAHEAEVPATGPSRAPLVVVDGEKQPIEITVAYLTTEALAIDYAKNLRTSSMSIQHPLLNTLYQPLKILFTLPSGQQLSCNGQTVSCTTDSTVVALELDSTQRKMLREASS